MNYSILFYHFRCKTIETPIFNENSDSLQGPLIIGAILRNGTQVTNILPFSVTFVTITRGSLVYHCVLSIYYIYVHVLSITVWIISLPSGVCFFYFFRFFSVYISLFCIYCLVWLCIAFFWFNYYYQKLLYEKTENWSSLEWSKEVYLFRAWLTRTLNNGYTCKLHL